MKLSNFIRNFFRLRCYDSFDDTSVRYVYRAFCRPKSLGTFHRMPSTALADIPYCGEDTAVENLRLPETVRSTDSRRRSRREHIDGRERMFEIPEFLRKV